MNLRKISFRCFGIVLFSLTSLLGLTRATISAQNDQFQPIYSGGEIGRVKWSWDSQYFTFASLGDFYEYDLATGVLTESTSWSLQPELTDAERQRFNPFVYDKLETLIFISPNQRYLVYAVADDTQSAFLTLGDRQTGQILKTEIQIDEPFNDGGFDTTWNADSASFIVSTTGPYSGEKAYTFVGNFTQNLLNPTIVNELGLGKDDKDYSVEDAYDLASGTENVLLKVRQYDRSNPLETSDEQAVQLVVWDALNPANSQFIDNIDARNVLTANFSPSDTNMLLIVTDAGLVEYDRTSHAKHVFSFPVPMDEIITASISPDGGHIAITQETPEAIRTFLISRDQLIEAK